MRKITRCLSLFLAAGMAATSLSGCSSDNQTTASSPAPASSSAEASADASTAPSSANEETITLRVFFSNPDQTQGLGLLEAMGIAAWEELHPNIKIELETLQDDPYQKKFQTYLAAGDVPDVYKSWNNTAFMTPIIRGGYAAELEPADYDSYGFGPGALEAYTFDDKLYGVPLFADTWVLYYNQKILEDNNLEVPKTFDDMLAVAKTLRENGIQPCALNGKEGWPLMFTYQNLALRVSGNQQLPYDACERITTFSAEPDLLKGAEHFKELMDSGFFMDGFASADYGTARSMFVQGQTAMFLMGSWEMGMGTDTGIEEGIRSNIRATKFPVINNAGGDVDDLIYRIGGGYSANAKSEHLDAAVEFVNFMSSPEIWTKNAWQNSICQVPGDVTDFMTGTESQVQLDLFEILKSAKTTSGILFGDKYSPAFQTNEQTLFTAYASGLYTPEELMAELDKLVASDLQ